MSAYLHQSRWFSINRYLGWQFLYRYRYPPSFGDECRDVHDEPYARNSNVDDHHDERFERTTLLSIRNNLGISAWDPWMHSSYPGFPRPIGGRELGFHVYHGRYIAPTGHIDHSTTRDSYHFIIHVQQRPQTEPPSTIFVCQMCTTNLADINTLE